MIKLMCDNLSLFCAYSYAPDEDDRVGIMRLRLWTAVWMEGE
jgi:hypothetical protein